MREVSDAGRSAAEPEVQLEQAEQDDERDRTHRDRRKQRHDNAIGKRQAKGQQQAEKSARGASGRVRAALYSRNNQLHETRADDADQVINEEALRTPETFEVLTEHPQAEHVERNVCQVAVQKPVGQQLPERKRRLRVSRRPQRKVDHEKFETHLLQHEDQPVQDQQDEDDVRDSRPAGSPSTEVALVHALPSVAVTSRHLRRRHHLRRRTRPRRRLTTSPVA